jgi:hypothetical protein
MKKQEKKKAEAEYKLTAVYTGRRLLSDNKTIIHRFERGDRELLFKGIKRVWIGHTYKCSESQMPIRPERADVPRIDNPAWEAADELVSAQKKHQRSEVKLKNTSSPALKTAIIALAPLVKDLGYFQIKLLIEHLIDSLTGKNRR